MKMLRIILSVLGLVFVIAVLAIGVLMISVDPNKLKPVVAAEIKKQTGYEVAIDGTVSWSFYPRIGLKVSRLALFAAKESQPFLDLHDVTFVAELSQLWHGRKSMQGDLYIAQAKLLQLNAQHVRVGIYWKNQVLTLSSLKADLYGGSMQALVHGRDLFGVPQWDWDVVFSDIAIQELLTDINGPDAKLKLKGTGRIQLHAETMGKSREQLLSALNGAASFALENGVVEGVDLNYLVRSADAMLNKQPVLAPTSSVTETVFDALTGTMIIKSGVCSTHDMVLMAPALKVNGTGSINLPNQAINFQLRLAPQQEAKTQWLIPVLITGNMYRPDVQLDVTEINIMLAKEQLDKVRRKVRDEVKEHVSGKVGDYLQDILGQ